MGSFRIFICGSLLLASNSISSTVQAQVIGDDTLSTTVEAQSSIDFTIHAGDRVGNNLFHSFQEFSVPAGGSATFVNSVGIANIISRVTGGNISSIDGVLAANGNANFILLNPNGIVFGRNAELQIGGSFLATTASRVNFADGGFFDADPQQGALLTMNVPIGLQFNGRELGSITNRSSRGTFGDGLPAGLEVAEGKTLALIGGDVAFEGGTAIAPAGQIEIGSVRQDNLVTLTTISDGWAFGYEETRGFGNIRLSEESRLDTSLDFTEIEGISNLPSSGTINLHGKNISLLGDSEILSLNDGVNPGGAISIEATELVAIGRSGEISSITFSAGDAGDISITTRVLTLREGASIAASTAFGGGNAGDVVLTVSESIEISGESQVSAQTFSFGNAGTILVETPRLVLTNGGRLSNETFDRGNGGEISITANTVEVSGVLFSSLLNRDIPSSISTGSLQVSPFVDTPGNGGAIALNAGDLTISNGGEISVRGESIGAAGEIEIVADRFELENGTLSATSNAGAGNIRLDLGNIALTDSTIVTDARGIASGGNISINIARTGFILNSDITANAQQGSGGNVAIAAPGLAIDAASFLQASSALGVQFSGNVEIDSPNADPATLNIAELPLVFAAPPLPTGCVGHSARRRGRSSFHMRGRDSLPPQATEFESIPPWEDFNLIVDPTPIAESMSELRAKIPPAPPPPQEEARGWAWDADGKLVLTNEPHEIVVSVPRIQPQFCQDLGAGS